MSKCPTCKMEYPHRKYSRSADIMDVLQHHKQYHNGIFVEYYQLRKYVEDAEQVVREKRIAMKKYYDENMEG